MEKRLSNVLDDLRCNKSNVLDDLLNCFGLMQSPIPIVLRFKTSTKPETAHKQNHIFKEGFVRFEQDRLEYSSQSIDNLVEQKLRINGEFCVILLENFN